jgi:hypothetical protein
MQELVTGIEPEDFTDNSIGTKEQRSAWTMLIKKKYGIDPLVCQKCGKNIKIIAIILDTE